MNKNKKIYAIIPYVIFTIYFILLLWQHQYVYMYFDDYGYASLTYNYMGGSGGTSYSFMDIIRYLRWHYFEWGGRVLALFCEIISFKIGVWFTRLIQAAVIAGVGFISWKLIRTKNEYKSNIIKAVVIAIAYGTIGKDAIIIGLFWYSASISYVWPLFPFILGIWLQRKWQCGLKSWQSILIGVLLFWAAGSYEQVAVAAVVYEVLYIIFLFLNKKKVNLKNILPAIMSVGGAVFELAAPGNYVRSGISIYTDFYSMSLPQRFGYNFKRIIDVNLGKQNWVFVLLMLAALLVVIFELHKLNVLNTKTAMGAGILNILLAALAFTAFLNNSNGLLKYISLTLFAINFIVNAVVWYIKKKDFDKLCFLGAAICSAGMMIVSPVIPERCFLPFFFIILIVAADMCGACGDHVISGIWGMIMIFVVVFAINNVMLTTKGYYANAEVNDINDSILREKSAQIQSGNEVNSIDMYRMREEGYPYIVPYNDSFSFMVVWLKEYYNIPQDVTLNWNVYDVH